MEVFGQEIARRSLREIKSDRHDIRRTEMPSRHTTEGSPKPQAARPAHLPFWTVLPA